jgi:hypothetical protein
MLDDESIVKLEEVKLLDSSNEVEDERTDVELAVRELALGTIEEDLVAEIVALGVIVLTKKVVISATERPEKVSLGLAV